MGLDVHLSKYDNQELYTKTEIEIDHKIEAMWEQEYKALGVKDYNNLTEEQREAMHKKTDALRDEQNEILKELAGECESIEIDSIKYPDHMFKIGYLRSSYNEGGINSILRKTIGKDLGYIFDAGRDYTFSPDWINCRYRATEVLKEFNDFIVAQGNYFVLTECSNGRKDWQPKSEIEALKKFKDENTKNGGGTHPFGGSYSNGIGSFFLDKPMSVSAVMRGTVDRFGTGREEDCFYVVYENKEGYDWYRQALEITAEMIDWVLSQSEPHKYALHWSG